MKRIAMVFVIAVLAVASVFSAQTVKSESQAKVVLDLKAEDLNAYKVGFALADGNPGWDADSLDMDNVPQNVTELKMGATDFDKTTSVVTYTKAFLFYKARSTNSITLSLSSGGPLVNKADSGKTIDYTIVVGDDESSDNKVDTKNSTSWTSALIDPGEDNFDAGTFTMTIATEPIKPGLAGSYDSQLTFQIKAE